MSCVLGLISHTPGKYELKYKNHHLNLPFHQAKDKLYGKELWGNSRVPCSHWPCGSWQWWGWHTSWVSCECGPHGNTHTIQRYIYTLLPLKGGSCVDQFLLYEGSRLLKTGPEGHQMGVRQRSTRVVSLEHGVRTWTRGLVHRARESGGLMIGQWCQSIRFVMRKDLELEVSDLGAQIFYV